MTNTMTSVVDRWILFFLFLYVKMDSWHVLAEGPPRKIDVSNNNKIIFAHYKKSLELTCPIDVREASKPLYFDWLRREVSLYDEKGFYVTDMGVLKIKSVSEDHGGIYTCECVNGYGFVQVNITVIVDDPEIGNGTSNVASRMHGNPPVIKRRPATKFIHELNDHATFHCVASSQLTPHFFWLKDGQQIKETENGTQYGGAHSILRLRNLKKSDAGVYKCIATNKFGNDEIDYTLHVAEPSTPPKILSLEPTSVTIKEGSTAVFWCKVKSKTNLKLHIKWLKRLNIKEDGEQPIDDVTLFRSGKTYYRPLNLSDGIGANGVHQSKLIINNVLKEDSGIYVCLALNDKGFSAMNGTLTVVGSAEPSTSWPPYFSTRNTFIVAMVTIGVFIILTAAMIISHCCCKSKAPKVANASDPASKLGFENQMQASALIQNADKKYPILYPDFKTQQSKTLLCGETHYNCGHTEQEISRSIHTKNYP